MGTGRRALVWVTGLAMLYLGACSTAGIETRGYRVTVRVLWPTAGGSRQFTGATGVRLTLIDPDGEHAPSTELLRREPGETESAGAFDVRVAVQLVVDVLDAGDRVIGTGLEPAFNDPSPDGDSIYDGLQDYLVDLRNPATVEMTPSSLHYPRLFGVPLSDDATDYNQEPPDERRFTAHLETPAGTGGPGADTTLVYPLPPGAEPFLWSLLIGAGVIVLPGDLNTPSLTFGFAGAGRAEVRVTYQDPFDAARMPTDDGLVLVEVDDGGGNGALDTAQFRGRFVNADGSTIATGGGLFGIDPRTFDLDTNFNGGTFETDSTNHMPRFAIQLFANTFFKTEVWRPVAGIVTHVVETVDPTVVVEIYNPNNGYDLVHNGATLTLPVGALEPTPTIGITSHGSDEVGFTRLFPGDFLVFDGSGERPFTSPAFCNFQPLNTGFADGMTGMLDLNYPSLTGLDEELSLLHLGSDGRWRDAGVATRSGATTFRAMINDTGGWCLARLVTEPATAVIRLVRQDGAVAGGNEPLRGRPVTYDLAGYAARQFTDGTGQVTLPVPPSSLGELFFGRLQADGFADWTRIEARTTAPFNQTDEVEYHFDADEMLVEVIDD